jgi:hypothetical protein
MPSVSYDYKGIPASNIASLRFMNVTNDNMNVNGSVTPQVFTAAVPAGKRLIGYRVLFYIEGSTAFDSILFGNLPKLTNGVLFSLDAASVVFQDNLDILLRAHRVFGVEAFSKLTRQINGAWALDDVTGGDGIFLANSPTITIRDNLSTLTLFKVEIQGELIDG